MSANKAPGRSITSRSLEQGVPRWLKHWPGDGIIARIQNQAIADAVAAAGIPTVDVLGVVETTRFPLVHDDDAALGRLGAEHLREQRWKQSNT